jgi:glycine cleavage system regulatory protein
MRTRRLRAPSVVVIALAGALVLGGCTAGADTAAHDAAGSSSEDQGGPEAADVADGASTLLFGASAPQEDREVITTGDLTLVAADPRGAVQAISELVESTGGRVEARSEHVGEDGQALGSLTVRVPAEQVSATVDALDGIGDVQDLSLDAEDVTATAIDLDARIQALGASVARLQALVTEAATTADLLAAEKELTSRQADLESLQSQRASITDQVDMSTLTIQVLARSPEVTIRPAGFLGGLTAGWGALLVALNAIVVTVGALLPWLLAATLVLIAVRLALKALRSRTAPSAGPGRDGNGDTGDDDPEPPPGPRTGGELVGSGDRRG